MKKIRRFLGIAVILLLSVCGSRFVGAQGDSLVTMMEEGNRRYEAADYEGAVEQYELLLNEGVESAAVYYNLGNSYFKIGELGWAILNYERAARLMPRDRDIRANLLLAREEAVDQYEEGGSWLAYLVGGTRSWLTVDEAAGLSLILWVATVGFGTLYWLKRYEWAQYGGVLAAILLIGGVVSLGGMRYVDTNRPEAVVTARVVDVISAPGVGGIKEFRLHSGAKVAILEQRGEWVRLSLPGDQLQGWVAEGSVDLIAPINK